MSTGYRQALNRCLVLYLVSQNFEKVTVIPRTTNRTRCLYVLRNLHLVLLISTHPLTPQGDFRKAETFLSRELVKDRRVPFHLFVKVIFKYILKIRKVFWAFNLVPTSRHFISFYFFTPQILQQLTLSSSYLLNVYHWPVQFTGVSLFNSFFKKAVVTLLNLFLHFWPFLSQLFAFRQNYFPA